MKKAGTAAAAARGGPRPATATEKSLVHRIRAFQWNVTANRKCADCSERGPTYICLTFQTFVCQTCSGIHRGFGHKIKGISLSEWNIKELEALEAGGNEVAAEAWLARWTSREFPQPDSNQADQLKEFIRLKYVEKRWWRQPAPKDLASGSKGEDNGLPQAANSGSKKTVAGTGSLLDGDSHNLVSLVPPPPSTALNAIAVAGPLPVAAAKSEALWVAEFGSNAGSAPSMGLLDLDCSGAASAPQGVPAPVSISAVGGTSGAAGGLGPDSVGSLKLLGLDVPGAAATVTAKDVNTGGNWAAEVTNGQDNIVEGLAGLDFGSPCMPQGQTLTGIGGLGMKIMGDSCHDAAADLFGLGFGTSATVPAQVPTTGIHPGFGANNCTSTIPLPTSHVESPLMEPAEEPAPTLAPASQKEEEPASLGDRLREAVLASSSDQLKHLFQECLEPPKRTATNDRFAAFAAFDELSGGGGKRPQQQASSQQPVGSGFQHSDATKPWPGMGSHPGTATLGIGQEPFAFGCGPSQFGGAGATAATLQPRPGGPRPATGCGQNPAGLQNSAGTTTQQLTQLMPQNGMMAPQQLEQMNSQELVQMHMMINHAMQARSQQQQWGTPTPAALPHMSASAPGFPPSAAGSWRPPALAAPGAAGVRGSGAHGSYGALGAPLPSGAAAAPVAHGAAATAGVQAAQRSPSPPREFGDLLAAFQARNPISGIELRA